MLAHVARMNAFERNRKGSRWSSCLDSDCLFPREQGATGMNSTILTASLTGRIQFFYCVALLANLTHLLQPTDSMCVHPPFSQIDLDASPNIRAAQLRGMNRGYEPPGAGSARRILPAWETS